MGQLTLAPRGSGIETIDQDHEHLGILLTLAERSAINGDRRHCGQMLQRAIDFVELHAGREEHMLMRFAFGHVLEVRRCHERLIVTLEQTLAGLEHKDRRDLIDELHRIGTFVSECAIRETVALRRFFDRPSDVTAAVA